MPLQNRVNPAGVIFAGASRGTFTGNRGVIHRNKLIIAPFRTKYWITCLLEYKGMKREVMTEKRWTELFFLDEATAFSAGHRPCAFCRHAAFKLFKSLWLNANAQIDDLTDQAITTIDHLLHRERIAKDGSKLTWRSPLSDLPDGTIVQLDQSADFFLYVQNKLLKWTEFGYSEVMTARSDQPVTVLTPKSIVLTFAAGYPVGIHPSAKALLDSGGKED